MHHNGNLPNRAMPPDARPVRYESGATPTFSTLPYQSVQSRLPRSNHQRKSLRIIEAINSLSQNLAIRKDDLDELHVLISCFIETHFILFNDFTRRRAHVLRRASDNLDISSELSLDLKAEFT